MPTGVISINVVVNDPASLDEMAFASSSDTGVAVTRHYAMDQTVPITAQADSNKIAPCDHAVLQARTFTGDVASSPVCYGKRASVAHLEPANDNTVSR